MQPSVVEAGTTRDVTIQLRTHQRGMGDRLQHRRHLREHEAWDGEAHQGGVSSLRVRDRPGRDQRGLRPIAEEFASCCGPSPSASRCLSWRRHARWLSRPSRLVLARSRLGRQQAAGQGGDHCQDARGSAPRCACQPTSRVEAFSKTDVTLYVPLEGEWIIWRDGDEMIGSVDLNPLLDEACTVTISRATQRLGLGLRPQSLAGRRCPCRLGRRCARAEVRHPRRRVARPGRSLRTDHEGRPMNTANGPGISSLEAALSEVERRGGTAWDITPNLAATTAKAAAKAPAAAMFVHGAVRDGYVIGFGITTSDKDVVQSLTADGWVVNFDQPDSVGLGKKWVVRSTADRSVLMQDVNGALARIGPPGEHQFRWQALGTDPGLGQASMCFTFLSAPIGAIVGLIVSSSRRELRRSLPRSERPSRVRSSAGFRVSSWRRRDLLPRLTLPVRRYRHRAEEVALAFAMVGPPVVALAVTISAGMNLRTT